MKLNFDYYKNLEQTDLYLCNPDGRELFVLPGKNRVLTLRFNDLSELTLEVNSKTTLSDGTSVNLDAYDYVQTKRLIYVANVGWFQISSVEEHDDGTVKYKSITAESLQAVLKNKGFFSEERVYCFYNPNDPYDDRYDANQEDSVPSVLGQWKKQLGIGQDLGQGKEEPSLPYDDWTVTYIAPDLVFNGNEGKCRTFKEGTTYGYDWMVNEVENAFEVVVLFDFMYKTIQVLNPDEVAQKVNVIYSFNNFMKNISINENADDIVTVLNCNGNNCNITAVNPTGTNYICDFSYFMDKVNHRWMSPELICMLENWNSECNRLKEAYESYVLDLRTIYQTVTKKKTLLQEASLSLNDLRTAQNKRSFAKSPSDEGKLCGTVIVESVKTHRATIDGEETIIGGNSIDPESNYYSTLFTGSQKITAYQSSPRYDPDTRQWDWSNAGASMSGTADEIITHNLSDSNVSGYSYWYFSDVNDGSSYCKLKSSTAVNTESVTAANYCGGFDRYIAYAFPYKTGTMTADTKKSLVSDLQNTNTPWNRLVEKYNLNTDIGCEATFPDRLTKWIKLHEDVVNSLNIDLYGYVRELNGYQFNDDGEVITPTADSLYGEINAIESNINDIASELNIFSFANTPELLRELNCYWIEGDYTNDNIAVLEETTSEQELDLSNELLNSGRIELSKVCQPRYSFSIESTDVIKQYEFRTQMRLLELGKIITIEKEEGVWYYPALLEISLNLDNHDEFSMTFANAMRLDDWGYTYADLISSASSTSRQVSANWQDLMAYSKDRETVTSLIKDPLDMSLRAAFANMHNQEFTIDTTGILGRKMLSDAPGEFEDEQVRLINNLLIFTDDNWQTTKTALGKISYKNDAGQTVTSYGLVAETIIGSLIMGEHLKITNTNSTVELGAEGITIKKADGTVVFSAKPDGSLIVRNYASQSSVDSLEGRMDDAEASIEVQAGQIALKASQSSVDSLEGRMDDAESEISQNASAISAKVSQTYGSSSSSFGWSLKSTGFYVYSNASTVMKITSAGAVFTGELSAGTVLGGDLKIKGDKIRLEVYQDGNSLRMCDTNHNNYIAVLQDGLYFSSKVDRTANIFSMGQAQYNISGYGTYFYSQNGQLDGTWHTASAISVTSDENKKNTIRDVAYIYETFFDKLHPVTYKYNDGTSNRLHTGFIAQEIEKALVDTGLTTQDFAGVVISNHPNGTQEWYLRYQEFVSLNTWQIQKLKARVAELEDIIKKLQENHNEEN